MNGGNVDDLLKYETCQWWYQRSFQKPEIKKGSLLKLCFDRIDCIAEVWHNNKKVARVENLFVKHYNDITDLI